MRLRWKGKERVFVPVLERYMEDGIEFDEQDEQRGQSFIDQGLAERLDTAKTKRNIQQEGIVKHVVVTDNLGVGNQ